jgi:hypothetical protein
MATAEPHEYLTLVRTTDPDSATAFESGTNVAGWAMGPGGGATSCLCAPNVVRAYTRVRLVLGSKSAQARILITDKFFSKLNRATDAPTTCELEKPSCQLFGETGLRYGSASSCIEGSGAIGRGNVDLRDTPFHIASAESGTTTGYEATGTTTYTIANGVRKEAVTEGGGSCGTQLPGSSGTYLGVELD